MVKSLIDDATNLSVKVVEADGTKIKGTLLDGSSQNPLQLLSHRSTSSVQMRAPRDKRFRRESIRHL